MCSSPIPPSPRPPEWPLRTLAALAVDAGDTLYAYETGSQSILTIPTTGGAAGTPAVGVRPRATLLGVTGRASLRYPCARWRQHR